MKTLLILMLLIPSLSWGSLLRCKLIYDTDEPQGREDNYEFYKYINFEEESITELWDDQSLEEVPLIRESEFHYVYGYVHPELGDVEFILNKYDLRLDIWTMKPSREYFECIKLEKKLLP